MFKLLNKFSKGESQQLKFKRTPKKLQTVERIMKSSKSQIILPKKIRGLNESVRTRQRELSKLEYVYKN